MVCKCQPRIKPLTSNVELSVSLRHVQVTRVFGGVVCEPGECQPTSTNWYQTQVTSSALLESICDHYEHLWTILEPSATCLWRCWFLIGCLAPQMSGFQAIYLPRWQVRYHHSPWWGHSVFSWEQPHSLGQINITKEQTINPEAFEQTHEKRIMEIGAC